ncbi:hypothetical protein HanIR_Chr01g0050721 [Helianthus annuus]|nr:hypothetical protein HanIR_Chr01g0050721 [Helianthus annuus]
MDQCLHGSAGPPILHKTLTPLHPFSFTPSPPLTVRHHLHLRRPTPTSSRHPLSSTASSPGQPNRFHDPPIVFTTSGHPDLTKLYGDGGPLGFRFHLRNCLHLKKKIRFLMWFEFNCLWGSEDSRSSWGKGKINMRFLCMNLCFGE